jgi:hypothetical protein
MDRTEREESNATPLRPRDFALLLLAAGTAPPRKRARDQQADHAGLELKRRLLDAVAALDPEPEEMEAALFAIVEDLGPPTGPTRSMALLVLEEWQTAAATPNWTEFLLAEAMRGTTTETEGRGQLPA